MKRETIKIFNYKQANTFLKHKAVAVSCGIGKHNKLYIEFICDENFEKLLKKWLNHEFEVN